MKRTLPWVGAYNRRTVVSACIAAAVLAVLLVLPVRATAADTVKLAVFPSNDKARLAAVMNVMAEYLAAQTGDRVQAIITRDYEELADRLHEGSVDIAWINTLNYIRVKRDVPAIRYMATYMEHNEHTGRPTPFYRSCILAMRTSGIRTLADARGKRFAFTDPGSTSGYAYPHMLLHKRGIDPDRYFSKVFFLKQHDRVVQALMAGSIDVGAVSDGTLFAAVHDHGDMFAVLARSEPIPLDAIVAAAGFPEDKVAQYRRALLQMPPDHPFCRIMRSTLGWSAAGFQVRGDAFYDSAREALGN